MQSFRHILSPLLHFFNKMYLKCIYLKFYYPPYSCFQNFSVKKSIMTLFKIKIFKIIIILRTIRTRNISSIFCLKNEDNIYL